ncbi:hypothetical protein AK830_g10415 [Neonectria ditissima]|uniref:Uncharacterized protein n=1 Tax=Neonectria ditissima TaxID=78410 RepID=A0A0P7BAK1_9HYPO|nr:hypothetical protein AK830_g10415 [Neonectria ditissima]
MAMESPALYESLIAWASGHMSTHDPSYKITALEARSRALSALGASLAQQKDSSSHETNSAACLVLLTSEVCLGNHCDWYNHLLGAKYTILSAQAQAGTMNKVLCGPDALKSSPEGQWVLRNFAYHDILGSVTLGTEPLIEGNYLGDITDVVDTYLGVASGILSLVSEINCLKGPTTGADGCSAFAQWCFRLESQVKNWSYQVDTSPELVAVAEAFRSASLIHLYRRWRSMLGQTPGALDDASEKREEQTCGLYAKIQLEVSKIIIYVSRISVHDFPETSLLFPLFLAGGEAEDRSGTEFIRERLQLMLQKRHFENIKQALEVLEEVWARRFSNAGRLGDEDDTWEFVLRQKGWKLLLT